jgi:hypothetical protein
MAIIDPEVSTFSMQSWSGSGLMAVLAAGNYQLRLRGHVQCMDTVLFVAK